MWILPKQLNTSAFVADTKDLGLDCEEFSQICEPSGCSLNEFVVKK